MQHRNTVQPSPGKSAQPITEISRKGYGQNRARWPTAGSQQRLFNLMAAAICGIAIASVVVFSYQEDTSQYPQLMALLVVVVAGVSLLRGLPRVHGAIIAYLGLVAFWAITYYNPDPYFTLVKVAILALAVHLIVRTSDQLLLLLGIYSAAGVVTVLLNRYELMELRSAMAAGEVIRGTQRFAGTFGNANVAGMYGTMVLMCALIVFSNTRFRLRWLFLLCGVVTGVAIAAMTGSRKAMLGIVIVAMSAPLVAAAGERAQLLKWAKGLLLGLLALGAALALLSQVPHIQRLTRLSEAGVSADGSTETRYHMAATALKLWMTAPVTGVGFDGFRRDSGFGTYSHTTFLEVLANGGLVGFTLISIFYFLPAWHLIRLAQWSKKPTIRRLSVGLLCLFALFLMNSMFAVQHDSRHLVPLWAGICGFIQEERGLRKVERRLKSLSGNPASAPGPRCGGQLSTIR